MADKTSSQLQEEAVIAEANAAKTKIEIDQQQLLLSKQKAQINKLQKAVAEYGQAAVTNPNQQQIYANAIIDVTNKIRILNNSINSTTNKINSLFTTFVNQENEAATLKEQASVAATAESGNTSTPQKVDNTQPNQPVDTATEIPAVVDDGTTPSILAAGAEPINTTPVAVDDGTTSGILAAVTAPININPAAVDDGTTPGVLAAGAIPVNTVPATIPADQGPAFDEQTGLPNIGWAYDIESQQYYYVGPDYVDPSLKASATESRQKAIQEELNKARAKATLQDQLNAQLKNDWRVKLSLAPNSKYLYNADTPGILAPLKQTDGVVFPYTPSISISYSAAYESVMLPHSNYKIQQYQGSSVESITIGCDFTAQDTFEANYLLAVIHFFRTATKMFYGKDQNPKPGTPPVLCYLKGLGEFQFDKHPLVIRGFTYTLPTDVDYIRAANTTTMAGMPKEPPKGTTFNRLPSYIAPGGTTPGPSFRNQLPGTVNPTYVPTKINLQIQALPIVTRNDVSNNFSLRDYATGKLLQGSQNGKTSGGFW